MRAFEIPENLDAVMLDMDGVVVDGMPYHLRAWREAFATVGIDVTDVDIYLREGMDQLETVAEISGEKGVPLTSKDTENVINLKNRILSSIFRVNLIPGSTELISRLKGLGLRLALVTGTRGFVVEKILRETKRLNGLFNVVVTADSVRRRKPDPEPYRKAVELLGTDRNRCLVIENSPAGIASAKRAGLACIALTTSLPETYLKGADCILHGMADVSRLFR